MRHRLTRELLSPSTRELLWTSALIFTSCLAILAIVLVMFLAPRHEVGAQATSRFDNVEITGTTDATGVVTARAGVRLTTLTTGPIFLSGTGVPSVSATQGSVFLRTDVPSVYQNTTGSTTWQQISVPGYPGGTTSFLRADGTWAAPPGSGGSPSLVVTNGAPAATVTLATEGTIDWIAFLGDYYTTRPTVTSSASKVGGGGYLLHSFETRQGSATMGHNNSSVAGVSYVGTAADNMGGGAFTASLYYTMFASSSAQTNFGWSMTVPASTTQRILRLYVTVFNCAITTDTKLTISGTTQSDSFSIGASQTNKVITITFTGGTSGDNLIVTSSCSNASNGSYAIAAATLGII